MTPPAFWMICRAPRHAGSKTEPRARFDTLGTARTHARTLADQTGEAFVILGVVEVIHPDTGQQTLI